MIRTPSSAVPQPSDKADSSGLPRDADLVDALVMQSGRGADVVGAMVALDRTFFQWRSAVLKGEGLAAMLKSAGFGLELQEFQSLLAIHRLGEGVTVGALAQDMRLDPSRASRLATKLIASGLVRRGVAQADARRAVLEITAAGHEVLAQGRAKKWARNLEIFADWDDADIAAFARLMDRYVVATRLYDSGAGIAGESGSSAD